MAIVIIIAIIIAVEVTALSYLAYRRRKARRVKAADEAVAKGVASPEGTEEATEPAIEIPGTNPMQELTIPPEVADSSTLSEEAKSLLMNAVWYRCENPRCNYTQFLDVYHIVPETEGGTNSLDNLIVLCPTCRAAADTDEIAEDELRSWVKERVERFKFALDWPYK